MPYIKYERKEDLREGAKPADPGELNYAITLLCQNYIRSRGELRYSDFNDVIGALECAKQEFYRRAVVPYEEKKREENGDVY